MSTRIYSGCEIKGHTLESFLKIVPKVRPHFIQMAQEAARQFIVNSATHAYDCHWLGLEPSARPASFIREASQELLARQSDIESKGLRDAAVDYAMDITLFPVGKIKSKPARLLAITFIENPLLYEGFKALPFWTEFAYWNCSDAPDEISRAEWTAREKLWSKLLPGRGIPSQSGYSISLINNSDVYHPLDEHLLEPLIPSLDVRASVLVDYFMHEVPPSVLAQLSTNHSRAEKRQAIQAYLITQLNSVLTLKLLKHKD